MKLLRTKLLPAIPKQKCRLQKKDLPEGTPYDTEGNSLLFHQWEPKTYERLIRICADLEDRIQLPKINGATPLHFMAMCSLPDPTPLLLRSGAVVTTLVQ